MDLLNRDELRQLIEYQTPPCLSLYQPTHRSYPDNAQDPIRFRNQLRQLKTSANQHFAMRDVAPLLDRFHALADDPPFWNNTLDGLAVFGGPGMFKVFRLQRPVPERAIASDRFHIKPLLRILQSADRYQVLGLTQHEVSLFEGNRDALDAIELATDVPRTLTDALGEELTPNRLIAAPYGGPPGSSVGGPSGGSTGQPMFHGQGSRKEEVDVDRERFFRIVDRAVTRHHSQPSGLPLILAALPEHQSLFRRVSQNPHLLADGVEHNPDALDRDTLRAQVWEVLEPRYLAKLADITEGFHASHGKGLASDELRLVADAAAAGRVDTLLAEAERQIPGRIDRNSGALRISDANDPLTDDLLDEIAALTLDRGGNVVLVPAERMPTRSGLAATFRY